jgi:Cof subfamily protein (haloacid dehalogenase superfamily)
MRVKHRDEAPVGAVYRVRIGGAIGRCGLAWAVGTAVRLVACDLDGTLLRSDGSVSARTRETLRRVEACGVPVVLVTGRPPRIARIFASAAGIGGPIVCCNGALVYDTHADAIVRHAPLEAALAAHLVGAIRIAAPGACFAVEVETRFAQETAFAALRRRSAIEPLDVGVPALHDDALSFCDAPVTKLLVRHPEQAVEALLELVRELVGETAAATVSGGPFVEISAAGVHKAFALEALCAELGIAAAEVVAFGDMPNDVPMLVWAGRGVAVANAHPEVLAAADEVTASNDEDGVALALERLVLGVQ